MYACSLRWLIMNSCLQWEKICKLMVRRINARKLETVDNVFAKFYLILCQSMLISVSLKLAIIEWKPSQMEIEEYLSVWKFNIS